MEETDRRKFGPPEDTAMLPWYQGAFSHGFVALHPFFRVEGLDPEACEYGTLVLSRGAAPEEVGLFAWADQAVADRQIGKELSSSAVDEVAKRFGRAVGWRTICDRAGFSNHCDLNRALRTHIEGLRRELQDVPGAERLISYCKQNRIFLPTEGSFQPLMERGIVKLFERAGLHEVVIADQFGDNEHIVSLTALRTESPWSEQNDLPPIMRLFAPDRTILVWVHWDSFFTVIFGSDERLGGLRLSELFEGFWCAETTTIDWLFEPCIALTQ